MAEDAHTQHQIEPISYDELSSAGELWGGAGPLRASDAISGEIVGAVPDELAGGEGELEEWAAGLVGGGHGGGGGGGHHGHGGHGSSVIFAGPWEYGVLPELVEVEEGFPYPPRRRLVPVVVSGAERRSHATRARLRQYRHHARYFEGVPEWHDPGPQHAWVSGSIFSDVGDAVSSVASSVSSAAQGVAKAVASATSAAADAVGSAAAAVDSVYKGIVPSWLRKGIGVVYGTPFGLARYAWDTTDNIVKGDRIDLALKNAAEGQLRTFKFAAPFAQVGLSFVPGVGQGVSAAIGAGLALSEGKPISDAVIAGIRSSLPGGPLVQDAFDVAAHSAIGLAQGRRLDEVALEQIRNHLPGGEAAKVAFDAGLALATGKNLQSTALRAAGHLAEEYLPKSEIARGAFEMTKRALAKVPLEGATREGMKLLEHEAAIQKIGGAASDAIALARKAGDARALVERAIESELAKGKSLDEQLRQVTALAALPIGGGLAKWGPIRDAIASRLHEPPKPMPTSGRPLTRGEQIAQLDRLVKAGQLQFLPQLTALRAQAWAEYAKAKSEHAPSLAEMAARMMAIAKRNPAFMPQAMALQAQLAAANAIAKNALAGHPAANSLLSKVAASAPGAAHPVENEALKIARRVQERGRWTTFWKARVHPAVRFAAGREARRRYEQGRRDASRARFAAGHMPVPILVPDEMGRNVEYVPRWPAHAAGSGASSSWHWGMQGASPPGLEPLT